MKRILVLLVLITSSINIFYGQTKVDKFWNIKNDTNKNGLPAIVVIAQSSNEKEWRGKSRISNIENLTPLDIDQSFSLASISKLFTTVIVLQLIDKKRLNLSYTISKHLDVAIKNKIPYVHKTTILKLLSHSIGIFCFTENNKFWKENFFNGRK